MKPLPAIGAGLLAAFLLLSPVVMAAGPTISVTPTSVSGTQTITISGTTTASAAVGIKVTNPSGTTVFIDNVVANSAGAYTDSFSAGGTSAWVTGTYTASATVASQTSTATFQYTAVAPTPAGNQLTVLASANSIVYAGQTAQIQAYVYWSANGTAASSAVTVTAWWVNPSGTVSSPTAGTSDGSGFWTWSVSLPSSAADGTYSVVVEAAHGPAWGYGSTGFTVNSQVASSSSISSAVTAGFATLQKDLSANFSSLSSAITSISSGVTGLTSSVTTMQNSLTSITNSLTSITNTLNSLSTAVGNAVTAANTAATDASNASSSVSSTQTYVLVVAVLAAITLVLELAILVRKLS